MSAPEPAALVTIRLDTVIDQLHQGYNDDGEPYGRNVTIADAIVTQAAKTLVEKVKPEVVKAAMAAVDAQIVDQVRELVAGVLAEPFTIVDRWGSSKGETTIRERIAEQVAKELKPSTGDRYNNNNKPVITEVIEKEVKKALIQELSSVVKDARDKVVGSVRDQAAQMLAQAVKDGLR